MTKLGHLRMADLTAAALGTGPDFWLRAGSVMPDILMTTYCRGHTFRGRRESTARALAGLVRRRELGPLARFRLGWQLHYLEDFFTHPHNESFGGTLADHRRYELEQEALLLAHPPRPVPGPRAVPPPGREEELAGWLDALHAAYGAEAPGPETDLRYAAWAARGWPGCWPPGRRSAWPLGRRRSGPGGSPPPERLYGRGDAPEMRYRGPRPPDRTGGRGPL